MWPKKSTICTQPSLGVQTSNLTVKLVRVDKYIQKMRSSYIQPVPTSTFKPVPSGWKSAKFPRVPWRLLQYHGACPQTSTNGATNHYSTSAHICWGRMLNTFSEIQVNAVVCIALVAWLPEQNLVGHALPQSSFKEHRTPKKYSKDENNSV